LASEGNSWQVTGKPIFLLSGMMEKSGKRLPDSLLDDLAGRIALCICEYATREDLVEIDQEIRLMPSEMLGEALSYIQAHKDELFLKDSQLGYSNELCDWVIERIRTVRRVGA
jgi:hypothetical protein